MNRDQLRSLRSSEPNKRPDNAPYPFDACGRPYPPRAFEFGEAMQSCPERLGRDVHIGAEWRHDGRKGLEGCVQFRPRVRLGETQLGRRF